ncbi:methyltransferase [Cystoisospora suis]|uniref:Methyltransferase n=1 Tax=Cystoisospora suis TaxID=483139 RepID=A0A2C6KRG3_9APIC|nr:methyltransferase [Cystoisospora suis]
MLDEAVEQGNTELRADAILGDLGQSLRFRAGVFDGAISISALQWLCNAIKSDLASSASFQQRAPHNYDPAEDDEGMLEEGAGSEQKMSRKASNFCRHGGDHQDKEASMGESELDSERAPPSCPSPFSPVWCAGSASRVSVYDEKGNAPYRRLRRFFQWLFASIKTGGRAVFQFYPDSPQQVEMVTAAALKSGFGGGVVVDYPNSTKAKKYFLVLWVGCPRAPASQVQGLQNLAVEAGNENHVELARRERQKIGRRGGSGNKRTVSRREWIHKKKEKQRLQGKAVRHDSKYTGRKRKDKF